jgi:dUTP pyrophosphatase
MNLGNEKFAFEKGHKVAQVIIQKIENPTLVEVDVLSESKRGGKGFGSTGK